MTARLRDVWRGDRALSCSYGGVRWPRVFLAAVVTGRVCACAGSCRAGPAQCRAHARRQGLVFCLKAERGHSRPRAPAGHGTAGRADCRYCVLGRCRRRAGAAGEAPRQLRRAAERAHAEGTLLCARWKRAQEEGLAGVPEGSRDGSVLSFNTAGLGCLRDGREEPEGGGR